MGKKFGMSFSWKRAVGISSAKARFARATGIPTTRQGRQRKAGAAMGCMIPIVCMIGILILCSCGKSKEPDFGPMQAKIIETRLTWKNRTNCSNEIAKVKQKISDAKEQFKDDPRLAKTFVETYEDQLKLYQKMEDVSKKVSVESGEQMRKAAFLTIHVQYAALQDSAARKEFMQSLNDPELLKDKVSGGYLIMKYPACHKEMSNKEYEQCAKKILSDLNLKMQFSVLMYDNVSDLENAYDIVKKLY